MIMLNAGYLPGNLSKISDCANCLGQRPEAGLTTFLSVISSLQNVNSKINLLDYTNFRQPLGLFNAICSEPSQSQSALINMIATKPLRELQREARKQYEQELAIYKSLAHNQKPTGKPVERAYFAYNTTQSSLRNLLNNQSKKGWGILILRDELAGGRKSRMTEYILSYHDGYGKVEALKQGCFGGFKCLLSLLDVQPQLISINGSRKWARLNYLHQPKSPFLISDTDTMPDINPILADFYRKVAALPQLNLRLSPEAEKLFIEINNKCEMSRVNEKSETLAILWNKMPGKIGRFAALIHIIHEVATLGTVKNSVVSAHSLKLAADLAKFYFNEVQFVTN